MISGDASRYGRSATPKGCHRSRSSPKAKENSSGRSITMFQYEDWAAVRCSSSLKAYLDPMKIIPTDNPERRTTRQA